MTRIRSDTEAERRSCDAVLNEGKEIFDGSLTSANAEKLLIPQKERLAETAREVIRKNGFDYDVRLEIGKDFFSTRTYDDRITLPAGEYEACLLYTSRCV